MLFGLVIILASCEEDEMIPDFDVIANAGSDQTVLTGEEVVLDGTASVDESGEGVQAEWAFASTPPGSEAVIEDAGSLTARFTPDIAGEYRVELNIENQYGQDSDQVTVNVSESKPATVVEIISESPDHQILETALVAAGLADALSGDGPFTVFAPADGAFEALPDGILDDLLADPDGPLTDILLFHVIGFAASSTDLVDGQNIETQLGDELTVSISGEQIFINNTEIVITDIEAENGIVHVIDAVLLPTIEIGGDYNEDLALSPPFEYRVTSRIRIGNQSVLTIAPGTRLEFSRDASLIIRDGSTISAEGTEQEPVILTATEQTPGWWQGVQVTGTQNPNNLLSHVIVEYGGGGTYWSGQSRNANLVVGGRIAGDAARLIVSNSTFRHSADAGIYVRNPSQLPGFENNTFTGNDVSGITAATGIEFFDNSSDFTGNETDGLEIYDGNFSAGNATWKSIGVPYIVNHRIEVTEIELTIEAGAEFAFNNDTYMSIDDGAIIRANGVEGNPILFTGTEQVPGWWRGFNIQSSMSTNNSLNYVIMEYGGGGGFYSTHSTFANLVIGGRIPGYAARLQVNNSIFRHSEMHGLHLTGSSEMPGSENNSYTQNERAPVFMSKSGMHFLDGGSSFTGNNGNDHILVDNQGSTTGNITWNKLNVPYRAAQELDISETSVTIEAGAQFEFESGTGLVFSDNAVISIEGTSEDPIIFTGSENTPGWWKGLFLNGIPSAQNTIDHAIIEYGGGGTYFSTHNEPGNLVIGGRTSAHASRVTVTNTTLRYSGDYGIVISSDSDVNDDLCTDNIFENNQSGTCYFR